MQKQQRVGPPAPRGAGGLLKILLAAAVGLAAGYGRAEWHPDPRPAATKRAAPAAAVPKAFSLVLTNGYGDCYRMNLLRDRENYQAYRGICSYRGFSLSGCSTTGEVVMLRIKATPSMIEHSSIVSTSMRWGTTQYFLNDLFHPLCSWVSAGYENWYPFDMSCSVAMYINSGGYSLRGRPDYAVPDLLAGSPFSILNREDRAAAFGSAAGPRAPKAFSLVLTNGYGDCYRMNLLRDRENYQAYRGICSYRGFSLSGCSTTGEVVMLRIKATPSMPEHISLLSTSMRWGTTQYVLNDVFHPLCSWVSAGYENWYPFDMSCSVAMYINSGGYGLNGQPIRPEPLKTVNASEVFVTDNGTGTNLIGALLPLTGDLADVGRSCQAALQLALQAISNTPGMPPLRLIIEDTQTDAGVAYAKLTALRSNGCHLVLGPESSEECKMLKGYANETNLLLISSSATAIPLALPDDNLMRLAIDDSNQARVLAEMLAADGITDIALLSRSDIYGEGLISALIQEHNARGGTVFATNYCPRAAALIPETVSNMAAQVQGRSAVRGAHRVGVVTVLFGEGVDALAQVAHYPALGAVRWYGSDGMALNNTLLTSAAAAAAAAKGRYVCAMFGKFTNQLYGAVEAEIKAAIGQDVVPNYPMACYDGLCLIAQALQQTGSTQTMATLKAAIRTAAANYTGCTGPIIFNSADDRASGTYDWYELDAVTGAYHWIDLAGKTPAAPENVTARQDAAGAIAVAWNPVSAATAYELWGALENRAADAAKIAELNAAAYELTGVPAGTPCYFWVKALNASGTSAFSAPAPVNAGPGIRINGSGAEATVAAGDPAVVTVEMSPGARAGAEADWWVLAAAPGGWYYRDSTGQWQLASDGVFLPAYQGPLMNLDPTVALDSSSLPAGQYTFYFGVDARDGVLDPASVWYAGVHLTVD